MEKKFKNDGFGWICVKCSQDEGGQAIGDVPRILREGESEAKSPTLSTSGLARWTDSSRQHLVCPRCGQTGLPAGSVDL